MATVYSSAILLVAYCLFLIFQELQAATCKTGPLYSRSYIYCSRGCCTSSLFTQKCCTSYYSTTSIGTIIGAVISSLVGIGVLVSLIVCCLCSKAHRGRVVRTGRTNGVTVVNTSTNQTMSGPSTIAYPAYYGRNGPPGYQPYGGQPQYMPPPSYPAGAPSGYPSYPTCAPPGYPGVPQPQPIPNQSSAPPASSLYNDGAHKHPPPPPTYTTIQPVGPAYPPQYDNVANTINVAPNPYAEAGNKIN